MPVASEKPKRSPKPSSGAAVAGVAISSPDREVYPEIGLTKLELARYYESVGDWILPQLAGRPLSLVRCPQGRGAQCFYQKHFNDSLPSGVRSVAIEEKSKSDDYVVIDDVRGLIGLVQFGVLEFHPWPARDDNVEAPDQLVFDLDPGEGVDWEGVIQGARDVRALLDELGLESFARLSGGKGVHVVAPISPRTDWDALKTFAADVAASLARHVPEKYVASMSKVKRRQKIFVDYLRNQRGATAVASYSTRARIGAPVATPISWDELSPRIKPDHYSVPTILRRLKQLKQDPWEQFFKVRQSITKKSLAKVAKLAGR